MSLRNNSGTIAKKFSIDPQMLPADWRTDGKEHWFGVSPQSTDGVAFGAGKNANGNLEIRVADAALGMTFQGPFPQPATYDIHIAITWNKGSISVFINGKQVDQGSLPPIQ